MDQCAVVLDALALDAVVGETSRGIKPRSHPIVVARSQSVPSHVVSLQQAIDFLFFLYI